MAPSASVEDSTVWHDELRPKVDAAIASLPRSQRDAVVLRYLEARSRAEVAEELVKAYQERRAEGR